MNNLELKELILKEKKERDALILAHVYQNYDILEIADVTGDSFALAKAAENVKERTVIMCGVLFMAETVKILSPEKTVILPEPLAGCPMAEQLDPSLILDFKESHKEFMVAAYINTTAELKAVSDVCVTSSSAVKILSAIDHKDFLFIPDKNLGAYVASKLPDKNIVTMDGFCPTHNCVTKQDILDIKTKYPNAPVAAHPECTPDVLGVCDFIGATTEIRRFAENQSGQVIIATERGVSEYLNKKYDTDRFIQAAPGKLVCENMKITTLTSVYNALTGRGGLQVDMPKKLIEDAKKSIVNMLKYGG